MSNSCHCRLKDESKDICNTIEFKDGIPQSYIKLKSNSIQTGRYTLMNCLPVLLWMFGRRISNLNLLLCMILAASFPQIAPYPTSIYLFPFVISFIAYCLKEFHIARKFVKDDQRINSLDTKVCKDDIDSTTWGELSVGDVVYLRQGDTAPADIILLDSQQLKHRSAITYVTTQSITGCNKVLMKKSAYLSQLQYRGIQKNNWSHYRQILSGKLTYENPSKDIGQFQAYLKLVKDPKVEQLTIDNLIPRGSVIKTSLWVYGMVVYAGEDTKIMQMRQSTTLNKRPNFFNSLSQKLSIFCILLNFVLSLLFVVVHINNPEANLS
jgi:magnesium-transporting ATPase (P-type)